MPMEKSKHSTGISLGRGWKASHHFPAKPSEPSSGCRSSLAGVGVRRDSCGGEHRSQGTSTQAQQFVGDTAIELQSFSNLLGELDKAIEFMNRSDLRLVSSSLMRDARCMGQPRAVRVLRELIMKSRTGTQLFLRNLLDELRLTLQPVSQPSSSLSKSDDGSPFIRSPFNQISSSNSSRSTLALPGSDQRLERIPTDHRDLIH